MFSIFGSSSIYDRDAYPLYFLCVDFFLVWTSFLKVQNNGSFVYILLAYLPKFLTQFNFCLQVHIKRRVYNFYHHLRILSLKISLKILCWSQKEIYINLCSFWVIFYVQHVQKNPLGIFRKDLMVFTKTVFEF